ncbi:hypothetical protein BLNAU_8218 [Blattamonas nauphoetae]|uniref:Uncharacterized protein n=1 Tax=Blattamonas nauphoetae TaxID=2049346 RepID=A0ABQ9XZ49_9EUKA|nr:hypothetical protein BLNAU_8218 [Blattamonas nauphoetae]
MVRDGYSIDEELVRRASKFLDSLTHQSICRETLTFTRTVLDWYSLSNRLALVSAKLIPKILSTPFLRNLNVIDTKVFVVEILTIFITAFQLSRYSIPTLDFPFDIDPTSIRDVVFSVTILTFCHGTMNVIPHCD